MSGYGKYEWKSHDAVYSGDFKHNTPAGTGTFVWADGSKYIGSVAGGRRNGKGVFEADGVKARARRPSPPHLALSPRCERDAPAFTFRLTPSPRTPPHSE